MVIEKRPPGRPKLSDDQKKPPRVRRDRTDPNLTTTTFVLSRSLNTRMRIWALSHGVTVAKAITMAMKEFLDARNAPEVDLERDRIEDDGEIY